MSDINKVSGSPASRNEPIKKKKAPKDPDAFNKLLQVDKIDPDEQSKRRRPRQEEQEVEGPWDQAQSTVPSSSPPDASLFSLVAKGSTSSTSSTGSYSTSENTYSTESSPEPPTLEQVMNSLAEDDVTYEEAPEEAPESVPEPIPFDSPKNFPSNFSQTQEPTSRPSPSTKKSQEAPHPTQRHPRPDKVTKQKKASTAPKHAKSKKLLQKPSPSNKVSSKKKIETDKLTELTPPKSIQKKTKAKKIEKEPEEMVTKTSTKETDKKHQTEVISVLHKDEKDKSTEVQALPTSSPTQTAQNIFASTTTAPTRTQGLSPGLLHLVQKLSGIMTIMQTQGKKELSIVLGASKNPLLNGVKITLTEWSSAPCQFNIFIEGSPEAIALLEQNVADLAAAFNHSKFSFKVHQITTAISQKTKDGRQTKRAVTKSETKKDMQDQQEE